MNKNGHWARTGKPAEPPLLRTKLPPRTVPSTAAEDESFTDVPIRREAIRLANHRSGDRYRLDDEIVDILFDGRRQTVTLVNLSGGGAMIEGAEGLKLWDRLELQLGECSQVEAAVRWIRGNRFGLEFAHETRVDGSREETSMMLLAVISRSFPNTLSTPNADEYADLAAASAADAASNEEGDGDQPAEVEREPRHPLIWSGVIHHDHDSIPVRLRNISARGALIECGRTLGVGAELLLDLDKAGSFFATVNWAHGDAAGLRFHEPFDLQLLASTRPSIAGQRWVAADYVRDSNSGSNPWARQWGRSDLGSLHRKLGANRGR